MCIAWKLCEMVSVLITNHKQGDKVWVKKSSKEHKKNNKQKNPRSGG